MKPGRHARLPIIACAALITALASALSSAAESAAGIRLTGFNSEELPTLRRFVDDALQTIQRFAPPAPLPSALTFTDSAAVAADRSATFYLPPEVHHRRRAVITTLWYFHFRPQTGHVATDTVPHWLVAATDWLADQPLDNTPVARLRYPYTRYYLQHNQLPDLLHLAQHPVPPAERTFYPLYAESCAVALLCLVRNDPKAMTNFLRLYDDRRPLNQNLSHLLPAFFQDDLRRQTWYRREVVKLVAGTESLLTLAETEELRQRYETISVAPAGVLESEARRIPLDEIHLHMPKWRLTSRVVLNLQRRFLELRQRSHPLLRPALQEYVNAIPGFQAADRTRAGKQLAAARQAFKDAMLRARQYDARLDAVEAATTAGIAAYRSPFPLVEAATPPPGPATQRIEATLDR